MSMLVNINGSLNIRERYSIAHSEGPMGETEILTTALNGTRLSLDSAMYGRCLSENFFGFKLGLFEHDIVSAVRDGRAFNAVISYSSDMFAYTATEIGSGEVHALHDIHITGRLGSTLIDSVSSFAPPEETVPNKKNIKGSATDPVVLYTDGSALENPGRAGWAFVIARDGDVLAKHSGSLLHATNNIAELTAVIEGLTAIRKANRIDVMSDSKYIVDAFNKQWIARWKSQGWKTSSGNDVKNRALWERLLELVGSRNVTFTWVKGHAGSHFNEMCDELARSAAADAA